jgi:predicted dehydrogenase
MNEHKQPDDSQSAEKNTLPRRTFVAATAAAFTAVQTARLPGQSPAPARYRVAVIGHTGRGNYGHGMERVWLDVPGAEVVAVADADAQGLAQAVKRLGDPKGYTDYRQMLDEMKPDLVSVAPRWLDQHRDMVVAAAERGVRGIYQEKPMCRTLAEADEIVAACEKHKVKLAMAHQTRYSPKLKVMRDMIERGDLGQILEIRARGKDDRRGGGEDLWVLGTHMLNLMSHFGGAPKSCFGTVWAEGRPICAEDVSEGPEGIGPLAGDEVHAMFRLDNKLTGYFDSVRNGRGKETRFGLRIFGSEGVLHLHETGYLPRVHFLPDSAWSSGRTGGKWVSVSSTGPGQPEPLTAGDLHAGNVAAVKDLIASIEEDRLPVSNVYEARVATEMIVSVFESQRQGNLVTFPLKNRQNPLTMLE